MPSEAVGGRAFIKTQRQFFGLEHGVQCRQRGVVPPQLGAHVFYQVARDYGRRLIAMDRLPPPVTAVGEARRRRLIEGTLAMLREAADAGYKDIKRLCEEPAFEPVRSSPEYRSVVRHVGFPAEAIAGP
jgi:hypothetical protein